MMYTSPLGASSLALVACAWLMSMSMESVAKAASALLEGAGAVIVSARPPALSAVTSVKESGVAAVWPGRPSVREEAAHVEQVSRRGRRP